MIPLYALVPVTSPSTWCPPPTGIRDLTREMTATIPEDPSDPGQFQGGLGIERVADPCGANWGHGGTIFGYQSMAYWNEQAGRTVVLASTMFPAPIAAEEPLANLTDVARCELAVQPRP